MFLLTAAVEHTVLYKHTARLCIYTHASSGIRCRQPRGGTGSQMSTPKRTAWPCRSFSRLLNVRIGLAPKDVTYCISSGRSRTGVPYDLCLSVLAPIRPRLRGLRESPRPKVRPSLDDVAIVKDVRLSRRGD